MESVLAVIVGSDGGALGWRSVLLLVLGILAGVAAILAAVFWPMLIRPMRAARHILAVGTPARGTVRAARGTGVRVGGSRYVVHLDLDVEHGGRRYPARCRSVVDLAVAGPVSPGRSLALRVLAGDPQSVAVDWDTTLGSV